MKTPIEDFLAKVLTKMCLQVERKISEIKKIRIFCCDGYSASGCANNVEMCF